MTNLQILADTINSIPKDTAEVKWINGPYKHGNRILLAIHQIFHDESMDTELCSTTDAKSAMQRLMTAAPKCQNQLEYVIDHLHDKAHLSRFFMENMDSKQAKKYQSIFEQLKKFGPTYEQYQKDFANAGIAANSSEETSILLKSGKFNELKDTLTALRDYQQMREFAKSAKKHEGSLRALESGKISIEGVIGENPTLSFQVKMHSLLNSQGLEQDKHQRLLFDHFVKVAGEQTEHNYAIVICYCHDLKSSVESWNKNNPQNQISLVEIRALEIKKALGK